MLKNFRVQVIIRVLFLIFFIGLMLYLVMQPASIASIIMVVIIIIYQIYSLIHYVEKTNRNLYRFLQAIRFADFSESFSDSKLGPSFKDLNKAFNEVMREFRRIRSEKEENYRYLQTVVQHIGIGLIAYRENGDIELINNAAKRLLNTYQLRNINSLKKKSPELVETLFNIKPGESKLIKVIENEDLLQIFVYGTQFRLRSNLIRLVSLQNIQSELEEKEMEAWQKLIRVLTHEIMNSITPISSLAGTVHGMLGDCRQDERSNRINLEVMDDIRNAIVTIQRRSQGLLHFVDAYRSLTKIPKPDYQIVPVIDLFQRINSLMQQQLLEKNIKFNYSVDPENATLTADPELIEQVLINLLKNAIDAVIGSPEPDIRLKGFLDRHGHINIQISDNGTGIAEDEKDKIFVPFYTTKNHGSGIGLSLCRQIMRLHNANISFSSSPNAGTTFILKF